MGVTFRFAMMSLAVTVAGAFAYACSSSDSTDTPETNGDGHATNTGGELDAAAPQPAAPKDASPAPTTPETCALFKTASAPLIEPLACKTCASERCCAPLTKCYASAPPDAGQDGSVPKSACALLGECLDTCMGSTDCEDKCNTDFGGAGADWEAVDSCLSAACTEFCN